MPSTSLPLDRAVSSSPMTQPPAVEICTVAVRVALAEFPHSSSVVHVRATVRMHSSSTSPRTALSVYTWRNGK